MDHDGNKLIIGFPVARWARQWSFLFHHRRWEENEKFEQINYFKLKSAFRSFFPSFLVLPMKLETIFSIFGYVWNLGQCIASCVSIVSPNNITIETAKWCNSINFKCPRATRKVSPSIFVFFFLIFSWIFLRFQPPIHHFTDSAFGNTKSQYLPYSCWTAIHRENWIFRKLLLKGFVLILKQKFRHNFKIIHEWEHFFRKNLI